MLIQEQKEILQDLNDKFLNTFFLSFQKHQLKVIYHFQDTNHDISLIFFVSKSLQALFACM